MALGPPAGLKYLPSSALFCFYYFYVLIKLLCVSILLFAYLRICIYFVIAYDLVCMFMSVYFFLYHLLFTRCVVQFIVIVSI